jgi:hypothetical protein
VWKIYSNPDPHGKEKLRSLTRDKIKIARDGLGREFIYQFADDLDKNHRADATGSVKECRMYAFYKEMDNYVNN